MLQKLAQENDQHKRGRPRKRGQRTAEGQQRQIAARISNGVHFQSPVLPGGIESQEAWEAHLVRLEEALQPVGAWEKLCVYRIALSAWKHFRLIRHESAIVAAAILKPDDTFVSSYDDDAPRVDCVAEVLVRSACEFDEEFSRRRDFLLRIRALAGDNGDNVAFTAIERRQVLSAIIHQLSYDEHGLPIKGSLGGLNGGEDEEDDDNHQSDEEELDSDAADILDKGEDIDDASADNKDPVIIPLAQLRDEIAQITTAKGVDTKEAIQELVNTLAATTTKRQRRLEAARTHIGACLIPDERTVNRLAIYERQLDAASRRYLNDLYRAQALRLGQPVLPPVSVNVNVIGEEGGEGDNGLH
jgi:hypothetical protein